MDLVNKYDYRNLPISHNFQAGSSALFSYDASGLRVSKTLNGDLMDYYYTGEPEYTYFIKDYLGSVRMVLDEAGNVTENYWYSPYGEVVNATVTGQSPAELKFTGYEEENEGLPGFYYAGARYYNSGVGIWYSTDPAGQFASPYVYAGNSPAMLIDANGEFAWLTVFTYAYVSGFWGATHAQYNDMSWYEGLAKGAVVGGASGAAGQFSSVGSMVVGSTLSSTFGGGDVITNFGIGNYNWSKNRFRFADFSGPFSSDVQTVLGYMGVAADAARLVNHLFGSGNGGQVVEEQPMYAQSQANEPYWTDGGLVDYSVLNVPADLPATEMHVWGSELLAKHSFLWEGWWLLNDSPVSTGTPPLIGPKWTKLIRQFKALNNIRRIEKGILINL